MNTEKTHVTKRVYAIKDLRVGTFMPPTLGDSDAAVIRSFGDLVTSKDGGLIPTHPEDFALFFLGEFDCETGIFFHYDDSPIRILANASDFKKE